MIRGNVMRTYLSTLSIAFITFLGVSTQAVAAEKKEDQKVSVTVQKSAVTKSGYYLSVEFDYFHSKIVSGPGVIMVIEVRSRAPFATIKSTIQQTASDSFGGVAHSKTADWKRANQKQVFKKLVCGEKVGLVYTLKDTEGAKATFRTSKTIVKPSPARGSLIAELCPQPMPNKLIRKPIKMSPKKSRALFPKKTK